MEEKLQVEIEYTQEFAKQQFELKTETGFSNAKIIYEKLWNDSKSNRFLFNMLGQTLRKLNEQKYYLDLYDKNYNEYKYDNDKYIIPTLCWCIYDSHIKTYQADNEDEFDAFIRFAKKIVDSCVQMDAENYYHNPFVLTVKKVVKIYNERASKNYNQMLKWIMLLEPDKLSEEDFQFVDENGKDRELCSPKEFYYQTLTKALEKTEKFEECIGACNTALQEIKKFHYRNNIWFQARLYYSKCMIDENIEQSLNEYVVLANHSQYWFMYHKLSQVFFRYAKIDEALLYGCKACVGKFEYEKMVNLFLDVAIMLGEKGHKKDAEMFYQASAYYRNLNHWNIPEELRYKIKELNIDVLVKPNQALLQKFSSDYVFQIEKDKMDSGHVLRILPDRRAGFIKRDQGMPNLYFRVQDVVNGRNNLKEGDKVKYIEGKNDKGPTATNIIVM